MRQRTRGFTLVELMVVVSIIAILAAIIYNSSRGVLNSNAVVSQAVAMKAAILQSRARSVELTANTQIDFASGKVLALVDTDRNGSYGYNVDGLDTREIIVGDSVTTGISFDLGRSKLVKLDDGDLPTDPIPHPSGAYDITPGGSSNYSTFANDKLLIGPSGIVRNFVTPNAPTNGSFFIKSKDGKEFGLVHVSAMGEVRIALRSKNETSWSWQ